MATPLLDPCALKDVQVRDVVLTWDGDRGKAQDWGSSCARWEQDVGVALGKEKLIKTLLGAIDKRVICRNLSYAQVGEVVLREVNGRVNRNVSQPCFLWANCSYELFGR